MRARILALLLVGCGTTTATEPSPEESFTMTPGLHPTSVTPAEQPGPEPFGPAPWIGHLERLTHRYSNGCTDHREVDLLALASGEMRIPIILGWRRLSPRHREEPHFLTRQRELPIGAQGSACVMVTGTMVTYAHEGISGAPAYGVAASHIEPVACPQAP